MRIDRHTTLADYDPNQNNASSAFSRVRRMQSRAFPDGRWASYTYSGFKRMHKEMFPDAFVIDIDRMGIGLAEIDLAHITQAPELTRDQLVLIVQASINAAVAYELHNGSSTVYKIHHLIVIPNEQLPFEQATAVESAFNNRAVMKIQLRAILALWTWFKENNWEYYWEAISTIVQRMPLMPNLVNHGRNLDGSVGARGPVSGRATSRSEVRAIEAFDRGRVTDVALPSPPPSINTARESTADRPTTPLAQHYAENDLGEHMSKADVMAKMEHDDVPGEALDRIWEILIADAISE